MVDGGGCLSRGAVGELAEVVIVSEVEVASKGKVNEPVRQLLPPWWRRCGGGGRSVSERCYVVGSWRVVGCSKSRMWFVLVRLGVWR